MGSIAEGYRRSRAASRHSKRKGTEKRSWTGSQNLTEIADGRFQLGRKLGAGCFGVVYTGLDAQTKSRVAIKVETGSMFRGPSESTLREVETLQLLGVGPGRPQGVPQLLHFGQEGTSHYLVMELLGCSLEDRMRGSAAGRLQPTTVALIAQQAISRIEYIHSKGFVHGDIKPENFMFGVGPKAHHLYMIDFGLSKRYYKDGSHVPMKTYKGLQGTMRYASINAHLGMEYSRRDDLEAIGHMMLYFLGGRLPWSGLPAKNTEEQIKVVGQKKVDVPLEALCAGFPDAFETYLRLTRMIAFQERPAYSLFRELFTEARQQLGPLEDHHFEWNEGKDMGHLEPLEDARPIRQPDEDSSDDPRRFPTIAKPRKRDLIRSMLGMPKPAL